MQAIEAGGAVGQAGQEALIEEPGEQGLELQAGGVALVAISGFFESGDGAKFLELPKPLACRAFAYGESIDDFFHRKWHFGGKKEAVDGSE